MSKIIFPLRHTYLKTIFNTTNKRKNEYIRISTFTTIKLVTNQQLIVTNSNGFKLFSIL